LDIRAEPCAADIELCAQAVLGIEQVADPGDVIATAEQRAKALQCHGC
jgi:hypothetical protein